MTNTEKENTLVVIHNWLKRNGLKSKSKRNIMLEAYRRTMKFNHGNVQMTQVLAYYNEVSVLPEMFLIKDTTKRILHWYALTEKGKEVVNDLIKENVWNEYLNALIFSNKMIDYVNTYNYEAISVTN